MISNHLPLHVSKLIDLFLKPNKFLFQDGPLRIEASSTGSNTTISKIVRMVSISSSVMD